MNQPVIFWNIVLKGFCWVKKEAIFLLLICLEQFLSEELTVLCTMDGHFTMNKTTWSYHILFDFFGLFNNSASTYLDVESVAVQDLTGSFSIRTFSSLLNVGHDVAMVHCREIITKAESVKTFQKQRMLSAGNSRLSKFKI